MQAEPRPLRSEHRADIQGLRAVAVVLVVAFHAGLPIPGGFVGVDVFFVISGFVITAMLLRELERTNTLSFVTFYSRRARRLLHALALVVVLVAIASAVLLSPFALQRAVAKTGIGVSVLASNVALYKAPSGYFTASLVANPLLHMWSLSVEEQF